MSMDLKITRRLCLPALVGGLLLASGWLNAGARRADKAARGVNEARVDAASSDAVQLEETLAGPGSASR